MSVRRGSALLIVALALTAPALAGAQPATPAPAAAQPPRDGPETTARALGEDALRRFQVGKWQEAHDLFKQADNVFHAPTLVLYMAHCQARLGNPIAARLLYRDVVREQLAADAPPQFHAARGVAGQELKWLALRLATLKISVTGARDEGARVLVDRVEVSRADLDGFVVEPGEHVVEASAPGASTIRRTLTVGAGRTAEVELSLTPSARSGGSGAARAPEASRKDGAARGAEPGAPRSSGLLLPTTISLGVGGAALVVGTVAGVLSLRAASDVRSHCVSGQCLPSDQAYATSTERMANVSTGAFVAGGAALVTGIILSVVHARDRKAHPARDAAPLRVDVGPGYGAIRGDF